MAVYRTMVATGRMTSPGALVEAGSRSAGRRRGGAAAGQSGRALRAGPVRDQEGRSKLGSLTMDSPAVQIPRAARRSSCSLEEARWSSAGAAVAVQSRRQKSCELPCRSSRERACVDSTRTRVARRTKATLRGDFLFLVIARRPGIVKGTASPEHWVEYFRFFGRAVKSTTSLTLCVCKRHR